jgi:uncharacterized membrane protein
VGLASVLLLPLMWICGVFHFRFGHFSSRSFSACPTGASSLSLEVLIFILSYTPHRALAQKVSLTQLLLTIFSQSTA